MTNDQLWRQLDALQFKVTNLEPALLALEQRIKRLEEKDGRIETVRTDSAK